MVELYAHEGSKGGSL